MHSHGLYDVECDTTTAEPGESATQIKEFLASGAPHQAFSQLRSALLHDATPTPGLQPAT